jgi:predicted AlkP superfamily pyrophosphatase or phosphodiesterase
MLKRCVQSAAIYVIPLWCSGCSNFHATPPTTPPRQSVVIWISVDGDRADYVDRAKPPTLTKLMHEGAYTQHLTPAFPSLTFPSHTTEATGVYVDGHGIPGNAFYDTTTGATVRFPDQSALVRAEPIWITAERQGVRAAVVDWPLSGVETGPVKADYFGAGFDNSLSDEQRAQKLIDIWTADKNPVPLRLMIGYVHEVDTVGHSKGPDSQEVLDALRDDDAVLGHILTQAIALFDARMKPEDELYFVVTTDHGMSTVKTEINPQRLIGADNAKGVHIVTSGPICNIFLNDIPAAERDARRAAIMEKLKAEETVEAYVKADLPVRWHYADPTRVGDIVAVLKQGNSWEGLRNAVRMPAVAGGPLGMHGYAPEEDPEMQGLAVIWRYRHKLGGIDLGKVDTVQLEPTVAAILGIKPATGATAKPLAVAP